MKNFLKLESKVKIKKEIFVNKKSYMTYILNPTNKMMNLIIKVSLNNPEKQKLALLKALEDDKMSDAKQHILDSLLPNVSMNNISQTPNKEM